MRWAILLGTLGVSILCAQTPTFSLVNAASYGSACAPDSLATIFGSNLAPSTASATLDANGQPPTELAGTRVEIAGVAASLFYVSPGQINLVVPAGIDTGTVSVVIRSTASGASRTSSAFLRTAAPGVFTSDTSGSGPGAILNAVTFQPAPFLVQTPVQTPGAGSDTRTRLAVYGTGFRHAATVTATARDTSGNRFTLTVEYAAQAPGFTGLDQVNIVIPPDLDGAGTVTLSLAADNNAANDVTFQMALLPPGSLQLSSLAVSPSFVNSGDSATVTVGLNGVARAGGFPVSLRSSAAAAQVPPQVIIPAGSASTQATLTTQTVPATITAAIAAQAGAVTLSASLGIDPPNAVQLVGLSILPASILGGRASTGTVTLSGVVASGSVNVLVASDSVAARPPAVVSVPFGKSSADFAIATLPVTAPQSVTLSASLARTNATATLTLLPPIQLSLDVDSVVGGTPVNGTITLADPAPVTGATIVIQSGDLAAARPPFSVTITPGQTFQTFTIATSPVMFTRIVTITAIYGGAKQTASLTVTPQPAATLSTLTILPDHVTGGNNAQGTITLTVPAAIATAVTLFSNSAYAAVPGLVTILQGQISANFPITTNLVPAAQTVTITASLPGVRKSATLTVQ
jgi:uncharacterized protein (TIGR03437 family)